MAAVKRLFCCCVGGNMGGLKGAIRPRPKANVTGKTPEYTEGEWKNFDGHKPDSNGRANNGEDGDLRIKSDLLETSSVEIPPRGGSVSSTGSAPTKERRGSFKSEMVVNISTKPKSPPKETTPDMPLDVQLDAAVDDNDVFEIDGSNDTSNQHGTTSHDAPVEEAIVPFKTTKGVENAPPQIVMDSSEASDELEGAKKEVATAGVTLSLNLEKPKSLPVNDDMGSSLSWSEQDLPNFVRKSKGTSSGRSLFVLRHSNTPESPSSPQPSEKVLLVTSTEEKKDSG